MPEEIRVLQCFQCELYQVDIVKKAKKWQCKICSAKQSVRKEIFRGSGPQCRAKVQELNINKGQQKEKVAIEMLDIVENFSEIDATDIDELEKNAAEILAESNNLNSRDETIEKRSKWEKFGDVSAQSVVYADSLENESHIDVAQSDVNSDNHFKANNSQNSKWNKFL